MIVARKYIENKPQNVPNKHVKRGLNKQNTNLLICSCVCLACVLSLVLCVSLGACKLVKPNLMANNIWFYGLFLTYAIVNICFIYYNYKFFDFNVVFGFSATLVMLTLTFVSIYIFNSAICAFVFGAFLLYFSVLTNFCFKLKTTKAHSQFSLAHLFHFYIFIVACFLALVN